ncbi:YlxR family protein [Cellulomonas sp. zg-Y338]|uniref:YlxR family protein n=1 Tax=Cellulomonas chengniuliangii TaxID=2968084 RepID=A0ABY5L2V3_9CELL|nr:YlxR family protein [Cellulomonas chengniuliangii]MCC2309086.1 YlxR family protein [Cellulomonas chengniuliangii]MCC2319230.1 YlxR family protein [Cellulomonas chengniuliangii]MCC2319275.1 YlxR family protein [Cellulomonas chengniuliangii]UUI76984.1 YlxR family protein [Cellulomonas chengniuliangii]
MDARLSSSSNQRSATSSGGPVRTCVGCRSADLRSVLLRTVVQTDGAGRPVLVVDVDRRLPGRGAWLHPDPRCLELAERRRAFPRALRTAGPLDVQPVQAHLEAAGHHQLPGPSPEA